MARPERIDAVLFDFDGTLCNTEVENIRLVQDVLRQMGAEVSFEELEVLTGGEDRVTVPPILERHHVAGTIDDYERLRDNCYRTYAEANLVLEPGALDLLDSLRARGTKVGLVSMTVARCILTGVARLGILDRFDVVVCGDMVERRKPAPDPYLRAAEFLGVDPVRCVAVEDSPTGIGSAKAAGCHVIAYTGCDIVQDVSAADEVIDSFVGIAL
ncbi:MAG TPA: HAD family phosphatase [Candidatus Olsenella stercoravium]|uniref:HAD family phosphatase n=1 Tax=Candidatus Olsenella stercoravium TaxID=2838713 RepID=A0A9D2DJR4_9ACTN|nr:HAD family phosphatase [Candidatus Olsenella stercoravium]